jgi:hypothetical protein
LDIYAAHTTAMPRVFIIKTTNYKLFWLKAFGFLSSVDVPRWDMQQEFQLSILYSVHERDPARMI